MSKSSLPGSCRSGNRLRTELHRPGGPVGLRVPICPRKRRLLFRDTSLSHGKPQGDDEGKDERDDTPHDDIMKRLQRAGQVRAPDSVGFNLERLSRKLGEVLPRKVRFLSGKLSATSDSENCGR